MLCLVAQACLTLWDLMDCSPTGSSVPGILQARTLEWVAISFSNAWKWKVKVKLLSPVQPSATPRTAAYKAPPSMGFSRQEYWSGVPLPSPLTKWENINSKVASLMTQLVKNLPAMQETWVRSPVWEDALEKGTATHSSILAWRITWTERPSRLQSMRSQRVRQD